MTNLFRDYILPILFIGFQVLLAILYEKFFTYQDKLDLINSVVAEVKYEKYSEAFWNHIGRGKEVSNSGLSFFYSPEQIYQCSALIIGEKVDNHCDLEDKRKINYCSIEKIRTAIDVLAQSAFCTKTGENTVCETGLSDTESRHDTLVLRLNNIDLKKYHLYRITLANKLRLTNAKCHSVSRSYYDGFVAGKMHAWIPVLNLKEYEETAESYKEALVVLSDNDISFMNAQNKVYNIYVEYVAPTYKLSVLLDFLNSSGFVLISCLAIIFMLFCTKRWVYCLILIFLQIPVLISLGLKLLIMTLGMLYYVFYHPSDAARPFLPTE